MSLPEKLRNSPRAVQFAVATAFAIIVIAILFSWCSPAEAAGTDPVIRHSVTGFVDPAYGPVASGACLAMTFEYESVPATDLYTAIYECIDPATFEVDPLRSRTFWNYNSGSTFYNASESPLWVDVPIEYLPDGWQEFTPTDYGLDPLEACGDDGVGISPGDWVCNNASAGQSGCWFGYMASATVTTLVQTVAGQSMLGCEYTCVPFGGTSYRACERNPPAMPDPTCIVQPGDAMPPHCCGNDPAPCPACCAT